MKRGIYSIEKKQDKCWVVSAAGTDVQLAILRNDMLRSYRVLTHPYCSVLVGKITINWNRLTSQRKLVKLFELAGVF